MPLKILRHAKVWAPPEAEEKEASGFPAGPVSLSLNTPLEEHGDPISSPTEPPPYPELPAQMPTTSQEVPSPSR